MVSIHFEAQTQTWVIEDVQGQVIAQHRFQDFTPHGIQALQLTHKKEPPNELGGMTLCRLEGGQPYSA
jgi:hypothetical protein